MVVLGIWLGIVIYNTIHIILSNTPKEIKIPLFIMNIFPATTLFITYSIIKQLINNGSYN